MKKTSHNLLNDQGVIPLPILIGVIGVFIVLAIASFAPFKDKLLTSLYKKAPSFAAYVFDDDFESGTIDMSTKWTNKVVEGAAQANIIDVGDPQKKVLRVDKPAGTQSDVHLRKQIAPIDEIFVRFRVKLLKDLTSGNNQTIFAPATIMDSGPVAQISVGRDTNPKYPERNGNILKIRPDTSNTILRADGSDPSVKRVDFALDRWYTIEVHVVRDSVNGAIEVKVDGDTVFKKENINNGPTPITWLRLGTDGGPDGETEYYFDDFVVNDSNWIGSGAVIGKKGPTRTSGAPAGLLPSVQTSVTMSLNTNANATCKYDETPNAYDQKTNTFSTTGGKTHSVTLNNLITPKTYTYFIRCKDLATGEENDDDYRVSFRNGITDTVFTKMELVPTYESISIYSSFTGDENQNNNATFQWRKVGDASWIQGMDMTPDRRVLVTGGPNSWTNPYKDQWRASILMVKPHTEYEVKVTYTDPDGVVGNNEQTQIIKTRSDSFQSNGKNFYVATNGSDSNPGTESQPFQHIQKAIDIASHGDTIFVKSGTYQERMNINKKTTVAGNYLTIRNYQNDKPIIDSVNNIGPCGTGSGSSATDKFTKVTTDTKCAGIIIGNFIRISGFEIIHGNTGIKVDPPSSDIVLENLFIHDLEYLGSPSMGIAVGNIYTAPDPYTDNDKVKKVTVQNNEVHAAPNDPSYAPITTLGVYGEMVIRNNRVYYHHNYRTEGGARVHGSDCIVGTPNFGFIGGFGQDSDVYNNYCEAATDDGISIDGNGMNNRVWGNTITKTNLGISIAPIIWGPTYVFRNVLYNPHVQWVPSCIGIKTGENGTGTVYVYNNTWFYADPNNWCVDGANHKSSSLADFGSGAPSKNIILKNNILHAYDRSVVSGDAADKPTLDYNIHFDEDGLADARIAEWGKNTFKYFNNPNDTLKSLQQRTCELGSCQEVHGLYGKPTYIDAVNGDVHLKEGSLGIDKGVVIQGFNDPQSAWPYTGSAPDIGAFELGGPAASPLPSASAPSSPSASSKPGDVDHNNSVDIFDYNSLLTNFGKKNQSGVSGDLDNDGDVDIFDFNILLTNFGK